MAKKVSKHPKNGSADSTEAAPKSAAYFDRGISSDRDFIEASFAAAFDTANGNFSASASNAIAAHTRNALKMVELKFKYGKTPSGQSDPILMLRRAPGAVK